ncbi:MAG: ABC transporter ATP-binding protein [Chitinophagaceae bacterium]|nr:ABC transporter ATP-binding protein [Chitinophagaceae bacterium]
MIIVSNIYKSFASKKVLQNINLKIQGNQTYCILGRNGAGKSTLINIMCDIIAPDNGNVIFDQLSFKKHSRSIYLQTGVQSQYNTLIEELNGYDYLKFIGRIYNLTYSDINRQIESLTNYFLLNKEDLEVPIRSYSTGMKKKITLCGAFIHKPRYLFLDEPFANIDPLFSEALCKLIMSYNNEHRSIVIASHDLLYIDKIATHVGVLQDGSLIFNGSVDEFKAGSSIDKAFLSAITLQDFDHKIIAQITS